MSEDRLVGAERVIAVLIELSKHESGVSLDELTAILGFSKPTIHRALASLKKSGLASQSSRGFYSLGDEFLRMAYRFQDRRPEAVRFDAALSQLAQVFGETVHLAVLDGRDVVYRGKVDSPAGAVRLTSSIGARNPAYRTAVGKVLLGYKLNSQAEFLEWLGDEPLEKKTANTITSPTALWNEILLTRERDFGVDDQENEIGVNCIAIPVFTNNSDIPYAAISVSGLAFRTSLKTLRDRVEEIRNVVETTTK
jgi:DNA-binding IclR family transcriptional regulator